MNKFVYILGLSASVSLSCNLLTSLFRGPALVEATGPIVGMTVAASLDDQGQPVDASFTFPADQPQLVVLVWIGEVAPGPLTFSWFRVTEAGGDEALFEQTVPVEARGAAFSTGLNPGILAAGTYKVVATFAGQSETIGWDVAEPQAGDLTDPVGTSQSAEGGTPAPGSSGTTTVVVSEPGASDLLGPWTFPSIYQVDRSPEVKVLVDGFWTDAQTGVSISSPVSFTIQVSPAITGYPPGESMEFTHAAGLVNSHMFYDLDPCSLPGGSDLPGTSLTVSAVPLGYESNRLTSTRTLGADRSGPIVVDVETNWVPGARVHEGDRIEMKVLAEETMSGGSWQTGIYRVRVTGPDGAVGEPWTNPNPSPQPCGSKYRRHLQTFTYTVPPNPPATIELCIVVEDYAGNHNEKNCRTYYTGDLIGTLTTTLTTSLLDGANIGTDVAQGDAVLSLTLQADGTLTGAGVYTYSQRGEGTHSCGSYSESIGPIQLTLPVNGTWTKEEIVFRFTTDAPILVDSMTTCGDYGEISDHDLTNMFVGRSWQANWDGMAYTADGNSSLSGATWTSAERWTINLEPRD